MQLRWLLTSCLWVLDVTLVCPATFKIALIGPWSCDPMFSRAMPTAAANLALSRIQSDSSLSRGYHYSVKLLEEDCSLSKGPEPSRLTVVQAEAPPGPQVCCSASFQLWRLWGTWRATATSTSAPSTRCSAAPPPCSRSTGRRGSLRPAAWTPTGRTCLPSRRPPGCSSRSCATSAGRTWPWSQVGGGAWSSLTATRRRRV